MKTLPVGTPVAKSMSSRVQVLPLPVIYMGVRVIVVGGKDW